MERLREGEQSRSLHAGRAVAEAGAATLALLDTLVCAAIADLFAAYDVELTPHGPYVPVPGPLAGIQLLSMIGFSSANVGGSLLLALPHALAERTLPSREANLADWSGEITNQLLGRFKNGLLPYRVEIASGLPVVVSGGSLCLPVSNKQITRHWAFSSTNGKMFVRLEMASSLELDLAASGEPGVHEGELLLF